MNQDIYTETDRDMTASKPAEAQEDPFGAYPGFRRDWELVAWFQAPGSPHQQPSWKDADGNSQRPQNTPPDFWETLSNLVWDHTDAYGMGQGYLPPQGWDWSGIRDSSPAAIKAMATAIRHQFARYGWVIRRARCQYSGYLPHSWKRRPSPKGTGLARKVFQVTLPDGTTAKRTTQRERDYPWVTIVTGGNRNCWMAWAWSSSLENARAAERSLRNVAVPRGYDPASIQVLPTVRVK